jgi:hypothetical protein
LLLQFLENFMGWWIHEVIDSTDKGLHTISKMTKHSLVTGIADQSTNTLPTRHLARTASVIVVNTVSTVPVADVTHGLTLVILPTSVYKRLVLLRGQTVLLGYVRQPTGL